MADGSAEQEIVDELRSRAAASESTLEILRWLRDALAARGLDSAEISFSMIGMITEAFDMGLSPARWVASWKELSAKGHLDSAELVRRLGPLVLRTDESENLDDRSDPTGGRTVDSG